MSGWIKDNEWPVSMPRWRGVQICHSGLDPESSSFEAHEFRGLPLTPIRDYRGRGLLLGFISLCMIITGKKIFHYAESLPIRRGALVSQFRHMIII
jgi:hypothetical protein